MTHDRTSKDSLGAVKPTRSRQTSAASSIAPSTSVLQPPSSTGTGISRLKLNHPSSGAAVHVPVPTKRTASRATLGAKSSGSLAQTAVSHAEGGTWQWTEPADDIVEVLRESGPAVGLGITGAGQAFDDIWAGTHEDQPQQDDAMLAEEVQAKVHVPGSHKRSHSGNHNMDSDVDDEADEDDPHSMGGSKVRVVEGHATDEALIDLEDWTMGADEDEEESQALLEDVKREFDEQLDFWDTTMVAEYAGEIFEYMTELEVRSLLPLAVA